MRRGRSRGPVCEDRPRVMARTVPFWGGGRRVWRVWGNPGRCSWRKKDGIWGGSCVGDGRGVLDDGAGAGTVVWVCLALAGEGVDVVREVVVTAVHQRGRRGRGWEWEWEWE